MSIATLTPAEFDDNDHEAFERVVAGFDLDRLADTPAREFRSRPSRRVADFQGINASLGFRRRRSTEREV